MHILTLKFPQLLIFNSKWKQFLKSRKRETDPPVVLLTMNLSNFFLMENVFNTDSELGFFLARESICFVNEPKAPGLPL